MLVLSDSSAEVLELSKNYDQGYQLSGRRYWLLAVVIACLLLACTLNEQQNPVPDNAVIETVHGFIQNVESKSLLELEAVEVVDENGKLWRVEARGIIIPDFTPSHLNEHKVLGLKVTLTFYREGDVLVLTNITD